MQYISIDIETTGLNPIEHDIIEFAAIIDEIGSNKPIEKLPKFHRYIKKDSSYICDAKAIAMHPKIFEKLAEKDESCVFIEDLMYAFGNFLQNNEVFPNKYGQIIINVAGKNFGSFDYQFLLEKIPEGHWNNISFRQRFIDPSILYLTDDDIFLPDLKTCVERMNEKTGQSFAWNPHTAIDDAMQIVRLMRHKIKLY